MWYDAAYVLLIANLFRVVRYYDRRCISDATHYIFIRGILLLALIGNCADVGIMWVRTVRIFASGYCIYDISQSGIYAASHNAVATLALILAPSTDVGRISTGLIGYVPVLICTLGRLNRPRVFMLGISFIWFRVCNLTQFAVDMYYIGTAPQFAVITALALYDWYYTARCIIQEFCR